MPDELHLAVKRFGRGVGLEFHPAHETVVRAGLAILPWLWPADEKWLVINVGGKEIKVPLMWEDE